MSPTLRALDRAIEAGLLAALLLAPLPLGSVLPWAQAALELLVALTATVWVARMLAAGEVAVRATPGLWAGAAMVLIYAGQLLLPGWTASPHATGQSFKLYLAYLLFVLVLGGHLVTASRIVRLVVVLVGWGVVLASWALVNRALGRDVLLWWPNVAYRGRLVSTFVNANHQALYFGMLLFLAVGMVLRPSRGARGPGPPGGAVADGLPGTGTAARVLFAGGALILGVAIALTASRAGALSVTLGVLVVVALALRARSRSPLPLVLAAAVAAFAGYVGWLGADRLVARFAILAREPAADARWGIWESTLRLVSDAPVMGAGLGAFQDAIQTYRPPGVSDRWLVDYAHNDYLQLLAEGGLVGCAIFLGAVGRWGWFVVRGWEGRRDPFVRGLVMGGLGAVTAAAGHSVADFGLHMPANALVLAAILALVPAAVTLRFHRTGPRVDLGEWRWMLGRRLRAAGWIGAGVFAVCAGLVLVPAAAGDWTYREAIQLAGEARRERGETTTGDLSRAESRLRQAARLDPGNPEIQATLAEVADELAHRVWSFGVTRDGVVLRPGAARDRLAGSQELLVTAYRAYLRSLETRPRAARTRERYGWFLARLDAIRRVVRREGLSDLVGMELRGALASDASLVPAAFAELRQATRLDPASAALHRSFGALALLHRTEVGSAEAVATEELREAVRLAPAALQDVVWLLLASQADDLVWRSVPREAPRLIELAGVLERLGRPSMAAAALEDAVAVASAPAERVVVHLARARFLLRRGDAGRALAEAREALVLAPREAEAFAVLGEAYEAAGEPTQAESAWSSAVALTDGADTTTVNRYRGRLASILAREGDTAAALAIRRQVVQSIPNDARARLDLARLLEERGEIADALREYETARVLGGDESWAQRAVAQAFTRNGLLREAVAAAEQGVRLDPSDDDLRVELADLYARIGLRDRAREEYQRVLTREPGHEAASRGLRAVGVVAR